MQRLDGKVAIVTGGSKGIGRSIAERLAHEGTSVVVNYNNDQLAANDVVSSIETKNGSAFAVKADVTRVSDIERLFKATVDAWGEPDILVANAGGGSVGMITEASEDEYQRMFDLNTKSTLFLLRQATRNLKDNGNIVLVSSCTVAYPQTNTAIYTASKSAAEAMTLVAAEELGERGINVNIVRPGVTDTPLVKALPHRDKLVEVAGNASPFKRIGQPDDIAGAVAFLVSDDARWITGERLLVNGGAKL